MSLCTVRSVVEGVLRSVTKCIMEANFEAKSQAGRECAIKCDWKTPLVYCWKCTSEHTWHWTRECTQSRHLILIGSRQQCTLGIFDEYCMRCSIKCIHSQEYHSNVLHLQIARICLHCIQSNLLITIGMEAFL